MFEDLQCNEATWRARWEAAEQVSVREWEGRLQQARWQAVMELVQEEEAARGLEEEVGSEEELEQQAEAWWRHVECKARWEGLKVKLEGELSQQEVAEEAATRHSKMQEIRTRLMKQAREVEMNRVNTAVQKAKARRERLLRARRRAYQAEWDEADYLSRTGAPGRRNIWNVDGETATRLGRARRQEIGVGWKPDARPAAMRRRRYRPQRMKRQQQKRGIMSTLACLSLLLAMTADGAAPVVAVAAPAQALMAMAAAAPAQVLMAVTAATVVTAET